MNRKKGSAFRVPVYRAVGPRAEPNPKRSKISQDAIREYLAAIDDLVKGQEVHEVRVAV